MSLGDMGPAFTILGTRIDLFRIIVEKMEDGRAKRDTPR